MAASKKCPIRPSVLQPTGYASEQDKVSTDKVSVVVACIPFLLNMSRNVQYAILRLVTVYSIIAKIFQ